MIFNFNTLGDSAAVRQHFSFSLHFDQGWRYRLGIAGKLFLREENLFKNKNDKTSHLTPHTSQRISWQDCAEWIDDQLL